VYTPGLPVVTRSIPYRSSEGTSFCCLLQVPVRCVDVHTSVPVFADHLSPRHRQLTQSQQQVWLEFCLLFTQHRQACQFFPGFTLCSLAGCEPGQCSTNTHTAGWIIHGSWS